MKLRASNGRFKVDENGYSCKKVMFMIILICFLIPWIILIRRIGPIEYMESILIDIVCKSKETVNIKNGF
jgi:hypothetical protein